MSFFKKIFEQFNTKVEEYKIPSASDPLNTADPVFKFAQLFTLSGGYFNYCANEKEILGVLCEAIKIEKIQHFFCIDSLLQEFLNCINLPYSETLSSVCDAAFITCEHLIAYDGKIMLSTDNIKHYSTSQLPKVIILISKVSQIQENLSTAMSRIKRKTHITNITSISGHKSGIYFGNEVPQKIILITIEDQV